jgi:hypothetical protein
MAADRSRKFFRRCSCCAEPAVRSAARLDRRSLIAGGLAALGLAGAGTVTPALSQGARPAAQPNPRRIDIHHHFSPPQWIAYVKGRDLLQPANVNWTPAKSIEDMDKGGVAAAVMLLKLVSSDHVMFGTDFPPGGTSAEVAKELAALGLGLTEADMRNIDRDNAVRLLPRLQAS